MTKEESFVEKLGSARRKNELLRLNSSAVVKVSVGTITALRRDFHAAGYGDAEKSGGLFGEIFGKHAR